MHDEHSYDEAESLAVAGLRVCHCVGVQDVVESLLTKLLEAS